MATTEHEAEIAASAAALRDLGPGYDQALAEGLVERIGAEIDKRIAAQIGNRVTAEVDSRILTQLDRYAGCRHQRRRAKRMIRAERRAARAERADYAARQSIMLAIGSMLVALLVTAIVLKGSPGVAAIMLMALIWVIVGVINVVYAQRKRTMTLRTNCRPVSPRRRSTSTSTAAASVTWTAIRPGSRPSSKPTTSGNSDTAGTESRSATPPERSARFPAIPG